MFVPPVSSTVAEITPPYQLLPPEKLSGAFGAYTRPAPPVPPASLTPPVPAYLNCRREGSILSVVSVPPARSIGVFTPWPATSNTTGPESITRPEPPDRLTLLIV